MPKACFRSIQPEKRLFTLAEPTGRPAGNQSSLAKKIVSLIE
jgi:hypothetical protein